MSWKPEVVADSSGKWVGNALRFATKTEAFASALNLAARWTLVTDFRAAESDEPVNYSYIDGVLREVPKTIELDGDTWKVLSLGTRADGRVYAHLASTTRFIKQRNGERPIQCGVWIKEGLVK